MAIKLKSYSAPSSPFTFDLPSDPSSEPAFLPSPPTSWLSARDMKIFGARPLTSTSEIGLVRCQECGKPLLKSFIAEHSGDFLPFPLELFSQDECFVSGLGFLDTCAALRAGGKKLLKGKIDTEGECLCLLCILKDFH